MWQDTTKGDGSANESVEFLIATNGELEMARSDTLDFQILSGVACQLEHFSGEVFEDRSEIDRRFRTDARLVAGGHAEMTLDAATGELRR